RTADSSRARVLRLERDDVGLEELGEQEQHRHAHRDRRSPVEDRNAAAGEQRPGRAAAEEVREEGGSGSERGEPAYHVAASAAPLERVEDVLVAERPVVAMVADEIEHQDRSGEDNAS